MTANKNLYQSNINGCHKIAVNYKLNLLKILNARKKLLINFPANPKPNSAKTHCFMALFLLKTKKKSHN